jgi:hypothetical protein
VGNLLVFPPTGSLVAVYPLLLPPLLTNLVSPNNINAVGCFSRSCIVASCSKHLVSSIVYGFLRWTREDPSVDHEFESNSERFLKIIRSKL